MPRIQTKPKVKTHHNEHIYFTEAFWHNYKTTTQAETELPDGTRLTKETFSECGIVCITYRISTNKTKKLTVQKAVEYLISMGVTLEKDDPSSIGILHLETQTQLIIVLIDDS